jgi:hypothetical protein
MQARVIYRDRRVYFAGLANIIDMTLQTAQELPTGLLGCFAYAARGTRTGAR